MRSLKVQEIHSVAGGNNRSSGTSNQSGSSARQAALQNCRGLPDSTKVTISYGATATVGGRVGGIGGDATTTQGATVETTCGDLRAAEERARN
ncbi:putative lipoprotein [Pseudoxanthomonas suwonensis 11-1]|uniref:Putative lipoprotein n=1 Tax=Pseudoxanthomonas suwonensis (strain 11-1) TaxID=743721 RepID=E6WWK4_PSEUU|nr:putative lipoprotein [Pseudoxanthomonas suwonensis 11-1]